MVNVQKQPKLNEVKYTHVYLYKEMIDTKFREQKANKEIQKGHSKPGNGGLQRVIKILCVAITEALPGRPRRGEVPSHTSLGVRPGQGISSLKELQSRPQASWPLMLVHILTS